MLGSKTSGPIEWWPADAIVCAGYLLPPNHLVWASHLLQLDRSHTTILFRSLKCSVRSMFWSWCNNTTLEEVLKVQFFPLHLFHWHQDLAVLISLLPEAAFQLGTWWCSCTFITFETLLLVKKQSQNTVIKLRLFLFFWLKLR